MPTDLDDKYWKARRLTDDLMPRIAARARQSDAPEPWRREALLIAAAQRSTALQWALIRIAARRLAHDETPASGE